MSDSPKMRRRLAALIHHLRAGFGDLGDAVARIQGVVVPWEYGCHNWEKFLRTAPLSEVLDLVSIGTTVLENYARQNLRFSDRDIWEIWIEPVRVIFAEENVSYRVNDYGAVRYAIDDEFDHNRQVTISALSADRYRSARANFEAAHAALSEVPQKRKQAVRDVFSAIEGLFRLMFHNAPRLAGDQIDKFLVPMALNMTADPTAKRATTKLLDSFQEWVDAAHFYHHEEGVAEPTEPPLELTVLLVSTGASWLRWLAEIDTANQPASAGHAGGP